MIKRIKNLIYWWLDYVYVAWWQAIGFVSRYDTTKLTINANPKLTPIILIPGVYEKWQFMKPIAILLAKRGHAVHVIEGLGYNVGTLNDMATIVGDYLHTNQLTHCVIVAHSKGGLIGKYLMMSKEHTATVRQLITLNTPFGGSRYALFLPISPVRMFLPTADAITTLAAHTTANRRITSIYAAFDPHIPEGSYLGGAHNVQLNISGHFRIMHDKKVHQAILDALRHDRRSH